VIIKEMNTAVAMMNIGGPWWQKCVLLSSAKVWIKIRVALPLCAYQMFISYVVTE
jgi:hypothetical protein